MQSTTSSDPLTEMEHNGSHAIDPATLVRVIQRRGRRVTTPLLPPVGPGSD